MTDQIDQATAGEHNQLAASLIIGIIFGPILFIGSFFLIYWNEGRADLSLIAGTAAEISAETANSDNSLDGKLISATGKLSAKGRLGDDLFLRPSDLIAIKRRSEMYSWVEREKTSHTNADGFQPTKKRYDYNKEWTENPMSLDPLRDRRDVDNPEKSINNLNKYAQGASLGIYGFDVSTIELPFTNLNLSDQNIQLGQGAKLEGNYVFVSKRNNSTDVNPQVGDLRISYEVVNAGIEATIFGRLDGSMISSYPIGKKEILYRILKGARQEAISQFHSEYVITLWMLRTVGFLMMFIGLAILFEPVSALLNIIPSLGVLKRGLVWAVSFFTALALTAAVSIAAMSFHNLIVLAALLIASLIVVFVLMVILGKRQSNFNPAINNG